MPASTSRACDSCRDESGFPLKSLGSRRLLSRYVALGPRAQLDQGRVTRRRGVKICLPTPGDFALHVSLRWVGQTCACRNWRLLGMLNASFWTSLSCAAVVFLSACASYSTGEATLCESGCSAGLTCLQNALFPLGLCTAVCDDDGGACPTGTTCTLLVSAGSNYCLQTCDPNSAAPCPDSAVCTTTSVGNVCLPLSD